MLLAKFPWAQDAPAKLAALPGVRVVSLHRGVEVGEGYAYLEILGGSGSQGTDVQKSALGAALRGVVLLRLDELQSVAGASASERAPYHYIVETDVLPEMEDDLNAWYREEHLPGLASVPGTVSAARYRNLDEGPGQPRYVACYDLVTPETLGSPPWLKVRGTPWSSRVRPAFRNTKRTMFRTIA